MVEVYTQAEVDKLVAALEAKIPTPMPDNVKTALRTVVEWLLSQLPEVTP